MTGDESDANRRRSRGGGALKGSLGRGVSPRPLDLFRTGYCSFRYPV